MSAVKSVAHPAPSQAQDAEITAVGTVKPATLAGANDLLAEEMTPPERQEQRQQQAVEPVPIGQFAAFEPPATRFAVLVERLHLGAPSVFRDPVGTGLAVR